MPLHTSPSCCLCIPQTAPSDKIRKLCSEFQDAMALLIFSTYLLALLSTVTFRYFETGALLV